MTKKRRAAEGDEDEEEVADGNAPAHKLLIRAALPPPPPPPQQQQQQDIPILHNVLQDNNMYGGRSVGPPPLGLQLRKTESFLNLIQTALSKEKSSAGQSGMLGVSRPLVQEYVKSTSVETPQASNFPANVLKIGTWEYTSEYPGNLIAKCYYAKRKLVWELIISGLKRKIEMQWSNIIYLKATYRKDEHGILDVMLSGPPLFFHELMEPQPRKHTLWKASVDFTGGQAASVYRRHILRCPSSSLLRKNFEKLIGCDERLKRLSQQEAISLDSSSPVFETGISVLKGPNENGCSYYAAGNPPPPLHNTAEMQSQELSEFAEILLSDDTHGPTCEDGEYLMARVESLGCLLDNNDTIPVPPEHNNNDTIVVDSPAGVRSSTTYGGGLPVISRNKDSFDDLLENLPRVESLEFLFNMVEDSQSS